MLRTHRSLKTYCATLWWRWWLVFFVFPSNGAPVEWSWQGENRSIRGKSCPSATLSTTNPTWTDLGSNPGLRGERSATNCLSHGTAYPGISLEWLSKTTGNSVRVAGVSADNRSVKTNKTTSYINFLDVHILTIIYIRYNSKFLFCAFYDSLLEAIYCHLKRDVIANFRCTFFVLSVISKQTIRLLRSVAGMDNFYAA
jgi:hypothetical protein